MKHIAISTIVLCTLGLESVLARPSMHHVHRHMHKRVDFSDPELYKDVDWSKIAYSDNPEPPAPTTTEATAIMAEATPSPTTTTTTSESSPPVTTTTDSAPAESPEPSSDDSTSGSSGGGGGCDGKSDDDGFCLAGFGGRTEPEVGATVDEYKGNVGAPFGSNIQLVDSSVAELYKYTNEIKSTASEKISVLVWNKSGPDGRPNSGQYSEVPLSFDLEPGESKIVAFDENSQVAMCHDTGRKTKWGAYDCTFGEADFGNLSNDAWSGYDVSSIQNTAGNDMPLTMSCPNGETSSDKGNNYLSDIQPGGIGGNLAPGKVRLTTHMG